MTYRALFDLKFKYKVPTIELEKKFPKYRRKISNLALLELPIRVLKSVMKDQKQLFRLLGLKQSLFSGNKVASSPEAARETAKTPQRL